MWIKAITRITMISRSVSIIRSSKNFDTINQAPRSASNAIYFYSDHIRNFIFGDELIFKNLFFHGLLQDLIHGLPAIEENLLIVDFGEVVKLQNIRNIIVIGFPFA